MEAYPIRIDLTKIPKRTVGGGGDNIENTIIFMNSSEYPTLEGSTNNNLKITVSYTNENNKYFKNISTYKYFANGGNTTVYKINLMEHWNNNSTNCVLKVSEMVNSPEFDYFFDRYKNKYLQDKLLELPNAKIPEIKYYGKINGANSETVYFYTIMPIYDTNYDILSYSEKLLFLKNVALFLNTLNDKKYYIVDFKLQNFGYNKTVNAENETMNVGCILLDYDDNTLYQYGEEYLKIIG